MAVVAHTTYSTDCDCGRTNNYIADGHGNPPTDRSNRYISDGHGGRSNCLGHHCPSNPTLATAFMKAIRWKYERQHSFSKTRKKGHVVHVQLYVSPTEDDHVPADERMQMTKELIERTELREYPSIYIAHDNTETGHCHISLCPYALDGTHKLCMNNELLYKLRREMDHICVEHGYSIIECPELWGDSEYKDWFLQVKEEGKIAIHPPRIKSSAFRKEEKKRARNFVRSKLEQAKRAEEMEAYYKEITNCKYSPENDAHFYTSPYLYNPNNPEYPLRIRRFNKTGERLSDLELRSASLGAWAYRCSEAMEKRANSSTQQFQKQMHNLSKKAFDAQKLFHSLDIRTHEELILHIKETGQDIGTLKRSVSNQQEILHGLQPQMDAIHRWEERQDEESYRYLQNLGGLTVIEEIKRKYASTLARNEDHIALLAERSKEYRALKTAEHVLDPLTCKSAWEKYLITIFEKSTFSGSRIIATEALEEQIYIIGELFGIPDETVNQYMDEAYETAEKLRAEFFYQEQRNAFFEHLNQAKEIKNSAYLSYLERTSDTEEWKDFLEKLKFFGVFGFLLATFVGLLTDLFDEISKADLEIALWKAEAERAYADRIRPTLYQGIEYYPEVVHTSEQESRNATYQLRQLIDNIFCPRSSRSNPAQETLRKEIITVRNDQQEAFSL